MAWTYNSSDLDTTTSSGRLNSVRLLIGDVDTTDQQLQDEEINFSLAQNNSNIYYSASFCCHMLESKYARLVDTQIDGRSVSVSYSDRSAHYAKLAIQLADLGKRVSGTSLGAFAGGISNAAMGVADSNTDRPSTFKRDQFKFDGSGPLYIPDYPSW